MLALPRRLIALSFIGVLLLLIVLIARGAAADQPVDPLAGVPDQATLFPPAPAEAAPEA